jgi:hypothetical protein
MYQSVGTSLLPYLARAMSLPLLSRVIKGKAVSRGAEYGSRIRGGDGSGEEGDETEDLTALLRQVMVGHPLLPAETMPDVSGTRELILIPLRHPTRKPRPSHPEPSYPTISAYASSTSAPVSDSSA